MSVPDGEMLSILAASPPDALKLFGETLLPALEGVEVLKSRTGLVMLPMRDTSQGTSFHLGEVLMSEAHIRCGDHEGYGMRQGRDLEAAMAMALIDLALAAGVSAPNCTAFIAEQAEAQKARDDDTLRRVEATRVDMETF